MKKVFFLIFFFLSFAASAQQGLPEKKASFHFAEEPLEKVLAALKEMYSVEFSYSDDVIPLNMGITLSADRQPLQWILDYLASTYNISSKIIGRRVILSSKLLRVTQTVRGVVKDQVSRAPIPGANIIIEGLSPVIGGISDAEGNFKINKVPAGRQDIRISCVGYNPVLLKDVVLNTAKELVLEIVLKEALNQVGEVIVQPEDHEKLKNAGSAVSAYSFSVEESKRFAGSVGDPARMAANFAGVTGANDGNNALMIRGNSPRGLLWRIEGIEVPNPNHFTTESASSGVVSVLSSNVIGSSAFYTGAFPSEYGNALSGVFDISLRNGNNEKREHSFQLGALGMEASTEGPFSRKNSSSYLVNYRYSTLSLLDKAGVDLNKAGEYKNYQDLAFKFSFPDTPAGSLSLFGIGGLSRSILDGSRIQDNNYADIGITGLTHQKHLKGNIFIRSVLSLSGTHILKNNELKNLPSGFLALQENYYKTYGRASLTATKKISGSYLLEGGIIYSRLYYNFFLRQRDSENMAYQEIVNFNEKGQTGIQQAFLRARHSFSTSFQADYGLHILHFGLTNDFSLEPRLGVRWKLSPVQALNAGYGKHSKIENLQYYLARDHQKGGDEIQINKNLGFTRANHIVLGYEHFLQPSLFFNAETYFQQLYNAPVGLDPSILYSSINEDSGFITDTLINAGKGRNYGIELSIEKSFANNFYYLLNGSLYESTFQIKEDWKRNSSYNGNYNFHFLAGYEVEISKINQQQVVGINIGATYAGGTPYIPIDLEKSRAEGYQVYDMERAFDVRLPNYFRADLQLVYKKHKPFYAIEWRLDIRNLSNHRNPAGYYYDEERQEIRLKKQIGLLPILSYRVEF